MKPNTWMRRIRGTGLPEHVLLTAWALGLRADQHGCCWPSYQQIATDTGTSRRTAIRNIAALERAGWIMIANRVNGHGSRSNSYQLTIPEHLWKTTGGGDTHDTPLVTPMTPPSDTHDTPQGVTPMTPRSSSSNEVRGEHPAKPVHNHHLQAVINDLARGSRLP